MDRRIRILAVVLLACFGLLFLQLNNLQVLKSSALDNSAYAAKLHTHRLGPSRGARS